MFYIFTGSLITGLAFMTLGKYAAIISIVATATKMTAGLLVVISAILLLRKFKGMPRRSRPLKLPNS